MRYLVALAHFAASAGAVAATPPPTQPFESIDSPPTLVRKATAGVYLGGLRILFEKTTLSQVRRAASVGAIAFHGDGAEAESWLCYTSHRRGLTERIWIISDAEMGTDRQLVTGVTAQIQSDSRVSGDCPALPAALQPLTLDRGVRLGISDRDLQGKLGAPSHLDGKWRYFEFQARVPGDGKCEGGYDLLNTLQTSSTNEHVTTLYAEQVTSC